MQCDLSFNNLVLNSIAVLLALGIEHDFMIIMTNNDEKTNKPNQQRTIKTSFWGKNKSTEENNDTEQHTT